MRIDYSKKFLAENGGRVYIHGDFGNIEVLGVEDYSSPAGDPVVKLKAWGQVLKVHVESFDTQPRYGVVYEKIYITDLEAELVGRHGFETDPVPTVPVDYDELCKAWASNPDANPLIEPTQAAEDFVDAMFDFTGIEKPHQYRFRAEDNKGNGHISRVLSTHEDATYQATREALFFLNRGASKVLVEVLRDDSIIEQYYMSAPDPH